MRDEKIDKSTSESNPGSKTSDAKKKTPIVRVRPSQKKMLRQMGILHGNTVRLKRFPKKELKGQEFVLEVQERRGMNYAVLRETPLDLARTKMEIKDAAEEVALRQSMRLATAGVSTAHERITKHQVEIDELKKETRAVLAKIQAASIQ